jgi:hypothetical protein
MGTATVASGGGGTKPGFPLTPIFVPFAPESVRVAHFREDFTTRIFNAKAQGPKGAKSFFRLGVSVVQKRRIVQFQQDFNHKERKEHRDKNLWRFFFAIFVFFAVNSFLVAACRAAPLRLCVKRPFLSVKSVKSVVRILSNMRDSGRLSRKDLSDNNLRRFSLRSMRSLRSIHCRLQHRILLISWQFQPKYLSMNNLHTKPSRVQSWTNQAKSR